MNMFIRKGLSLATILTVLTAAPLPLFAKPLILTKPVKDLVVSLAFSEEQVSMGNKPVTVTILDKNKKPVANAVVTVAYSMPPMTGMPPMNYSTPAKWNKTAYKTNVDFSMAGSWNVSVRIKMKGKLSVVKFNLDVH